MVPFSIDKNSSQNLSAQVADGLRKAIVSGFYRSGAALPKVRDISAALGVSLRVSVAALKQLSDEGLVSVRPHYGSVVIGPEPAWRANVLIVFAGDPANYHTNLFVHAVRDALSFARIRVSLVVVSHCAIARELKSLKMVLRDAFNLVVLKQVDESVVRAVSESGCPFVTVDCSGASFPGHVGTIGYHRDLAVGDFVDACCVAGVRRILQVRAYAEVNVRAAMKAAGISVEDWRLPERHGQGIRGRVRQDAFDLFSKRISKRADIPGELIFFNDDYAAAGGLLALAMRGIAVPRDVKVVTWANAGDVPVAPVALTCMLMDPIEQGRRLVDSILRFVRDGFFPADFSIGPRYVAGDSL